MTSINEEQVAFRNASFIIEDAKETFKARMLINGGAAIALLAVIGHLVTQEQYDSITDFCLLLSGLWSELRAHPWAMDSRMEPI